MENPYWKFFCGETYPQTELPIDPSSLMRRGKRIGEEGIETLLPASDAARRGGVVHKSSMQQLIVDTTVMPKAIAIPPTCWTSAASIWLCRDSGLL